MEEKKLPYSIEAEMSVLGAMMLNEKALLKGVQMLREDDFYFGSHRKIFSAIVDLSEKKKMVDVLSVREELKRRKQLEEIGGASYLASLVESVISPALAERHIQIVVEKSITRRIIEVATEILEQAYEEKLEAYELLDLAEHKIFEIREKGVREDFVKVSEVVREVFETIDELMMHKRHVTGVPSGIWDLDMITAGFQPGELIVVASRPAMGKTSFVLNIVRHLSLDRGEPTAMFSLEMSKEQMVQRLLAMESRVSAQKLRTGFISGEDIKELTRAADKLRKAPIFVDDTPAIPLLELRAKARRIVKEESAKVIVVDYLQLIQGPKEAENRQQEISAISRSLKALAKELNVPIIAVSQLSRAVEHRADKRPQLADLRESGAIEQDADTVMFIYRPEVYDDDPQYKNLAEIIIGKQRHGPIGTVRLAFFKEYMRFEALTREEEEELIF